MSAPDRKAASVRARISRTLAVATVLATCLALPAPAAFGANSIYWLNFVRGQIEFASLDGAVGGPLTPPAAAPVDHPAGFAIDSATGRIYWSNIGGGGSLAFADLDDAGGGMLTPPASAPVADPQDVAIDPAARRIYWTNFFGDNQPTRQGSIAYASLDDPTSGGRLTIPPAASIDGPEGITIDLAGRRIYWGNSIDGTIGYADLDDPGGGTLAPPASAAAAGAPWKLAIDPTTRRIYWGDANGGSAIAFMSLDAPTSGGTLAPPAGTPISSPSGLAIDLVTRRIYWSNFNGASIAYASLDDATVGGQLTMPPGTLVDAPGALVLLYAPRALTPPTIAGGQVAGSTLSCSQGTWTADSVAQMLYQAPHSFAYQWSRGGSDIPGAMQSTLTATSSGDYRCRVTASNHAGVATQTSDAHHVAAPALPPAFGRSTLVTLTLAASRVSARGPIQVRIANANGFAITGSLVVQTSKPVAAAHKRRVKLRSTKLALGPHVKRTIKLALPKLLQRVLASRHQLSLTLSAAVTDPAGGRRAVSRTVRARLAAPKRRR